jgi:hypothetical protein
MSVILPSRNSSALRKFYKIELLGLISRLQEISPNSVWFTTARWGAARPGLTTRPYFYFQLVSLNSQDKMVVKVLISGLRDLALNFKARAYVNDTPRGRVLCLHIFLMDVDEIPKVIYKHPF